VIPKLYYGPGACSLAPHICLEEAGAEAEYVRVELSKGEQMSPEYLALNPNARVPLLITDKGVLSEATAIMSWIALTWPEARLLPEGDSWALAQVLSFCNFLTSSVHAGAFGAVFRPARFSDDPAMHPAIKAKGLAGLKKHFALIDSRMQPGGWVQGGYTICDPYLFAMTRWLVRLGEDLAQFPKIAAHAELMLERPAVQRAFEREGIVFG
jgi:glutathione S-transferase